MTHVGSCRIHYAEETCTCGAGDGTNDPAYETIRAVLAELEEAVSDKLGTMNFYFGPGARTAVSSESRRAYERIRDARDAARAALASPEARP